MSAATTKMKLYNTQVEQHLQTEINREIWFRVLVQAGIFDILITFFIIYMLLVPAATIFLIQQSPLTIVINFSKENQTKKLSF